MAEESKLMTMKEAISKFVSDGMTLYISAVWANHAAAAAHEIIRQGKKDLTLIESSPGEIFDQMIGAGCAKRLILSWSANEAFGTGYRFRRAVEKGLVEVEDYSNFGLTAKLMAGAMGIPFMPIHVSERVIDQRNQVLPWRKQAETCGLPFHWAKGNADLGHQPRCLHHPLSTCRPGG